MSACCVHRDVAASHPPDWRPPFAPRHGFQCRLLLAICCLQLVSIGDPAAAADREGLLVYAAVSTSECLQTLAASYEALSHVHVVCSFASSSTLAKQIEAGAPADLFLSADPEWMDVLVEHHAVKADTRADLLGNDLVFITPAGAARAIRPEKGFAIASAFAGRLAMGDPSHVPAGIYAKQTLVSLGWWDALAGRLAPAADVRAVLRLVELGEAEVGIVYATDAKASAKVSVAADIPATLHEPIRYPLALTSDARPEAAAFRAFLFSPAAAAVFTTAGFSIPTPATPAVK
jgi:molybdate transport system substrate-binding protein